MTSLEERVARAIMLNRVDGKTCFVEDWQREAKENPHVEAALRQARAAIAVCADEMAKVAETHSTATAEMADAKYYASASSAVLNCGRGIAAAIRSMGERGE